MSKIYLIRYHVPEFDDGDILGAFPDIEFAEAFLTELRQKAGQYQDAIDNWQNEHLNNTSYEYDEDFENNLVPVLTQIGNSINQLLSNRSQHSYQVKFGPNDENPYVWFIQNISESRLFIDEIELSKPMMEKKLFKENTNKIKIKISLNEKLNQPQQVIKPTIRHGKKWSCKDAGLYAEGVWVDIRNGIGQLIKPFDGRLADRLLCNEDEMFLYGRDNAIEEGNRGMAILDANTEDDAFWVWESDESTRNYNLSSPKYWKEDDPESMLGSAPHQSLILKCRGK